MGQAQWILLKIINTLLSHNIQVNNAVLTYGKFYNPAKGTDYEISREEISDMEILARHSEEVASCGRAASPTGTEGSIDLYYSGTKICTVYWDCPYSGSNKLEIRNNGGAGYLCTLKTLDWGRDNGHAIGNVNVEVSGAGGLAIDINL